VRRITRTILTAAVLPGAGSGVLSAQSTDWAHYGGTQWNERHVSLTQITTDNVANLVPRRVLQLGEVPLPCSSSACPGSGNPLQGSDRG
jgi:glucose dehydrogenase